MTRIFIFIFSLFLFLLAQKADEIIGFETRFYLFAQEALRHGLNYFPTIYGELYPDYPIGGTALIVLSAKYFGVLNKWTALLPSAIFSAATVSLVYCIGALRNEVWGKAAAGFLLLTYLFMQSARYISLDVYPMFACVLAFFFVLSAFEKKQKFPWFLAVFCLVFGFTFRGTLGWCLPLAALVSVCVAYSKWNELIRLILISLIVLVLLNILLSWMAFHAGGKAFLHTVFDMQIFSRLKDAKSVPFYFYFFDIWFNQALAFPIAAMVIFGLCLRKKIQQSDKKFLFSFILFIGLVLFGMSIPADKKSRYILAISPIAALLAGYLWMAPREEVYWRMARRITQVILMFMPLLCAVVIVIEKKWVLLSVASVTYYWVIGSLIAFQLLGAWVALLEFRHFYKPRLFVLYLAVLATWGVWISVYAKVLQKTEATLGFVRAVERMRKLESAQLVFLDKDKDGFAIKYVIDTNEEVHPVFVQNAASLKSQSAIKKVFLVADHQSGIDLKQANSKYWRVVFEGKVGHQSVMVLQGGE